jgi:hypothetical protein
MKIIKETSAELVVRISPSISTTIFMLIWSPGMIGFATLVFYTIFNNSGDLKIICDRQIVGSVNCQFQIAPLFRIAPLRISNYNSVTAIRYMEPTETKKEGEGGDTLVNHQILLTTELGYSSAYRHFVFARRGEKSRSMKLENIVNKLSLFMLQPQEKLIVIEENLDFDYTLILPLFFMVIGILGFHAVIKIVNFSINKTSSKISVSYLSILGLWKYSFDLKEIQDIKVEVRRSKDLTKGACDFLRRKIKSPC